MTSRRLIALLALLAALGFAGAASAISARAPAAHAAETVALTAIDTTTPDAKRVPMPPPIVFFVARGDADACGPGCREWIAADGTIDEGADGRLRALLKRLGGRKLPIYFHSPGGSVVTGIAIGRLMRERGLTAGAGWTVPAGCDRQQQREPACDKLKRSGRDLVAELDSRHIMCNSACVYALVGAAVRDVGAGVKLGIHSSSVSFSLVRTDRTGRVSRVPTRVAPAVARKSMEAGYDRLAAYLRDMGIAPGLLTAARQIGSDRVRFLSRDEIVDFGIDRRERVEGMWWIVDEPSGASAMKLIETRELDAGAFRKTIVRLSCRNSSTVQLQYGREVGAEKAGLSVALRVGVGASTFRLGRGVNVTQRDSPMPMEVYSADLPLSALESPAFVIETAEPSAPSPGLAALDAHPPRLIAQAAGGALGALVRRCHNGPSIFDAGAPHERI